MKREPLNSFRSTSSKLRLAFVASCVASTLAAQPSTSMVGLGRRDKSTIEEFAIPFTLDAPLLKSYAAVKAAYADLKLNADIDDPAGGTVGIQLAKSQTTFAGFRMSRLFDCGQSPPAAPNADSYRLSIVFLTLVDRVDDSHTRLRIGVVASAVPSTGSRSATVQCGSTGVLEQKLVDLANAHLR